MIQSNAKYNRAKASRRSGHLTENEMEEFEIPNYPDWDYLYSQASLTR